MNEKPLVSIVTISFNQAAYLERTVLSVLDQDYENIEYVVVDPGSTDGSREIIERHRALISQIIFEQDAGPADGLNKGFAAARGEIFAFLNSDDVLLPGAVREAVAALECRPEIDVVSGHAQIIDHKDLPLRKAFSGRFDLTAYAYGGMELMQPSTFFRRRIFEASGGFNLENRSNWDGELWVDMALAGARFALVNRYWSGYRLQPGSITSSRIMDDAIARYRRRMFVKITGRKWRRIDAFQAAKFRVMRHLLHPRALYQRLRHGKIYGRPV